MANERPSNFDLAQLKNHVSSPCLFFIDGGIIVNNTTMDPVLPLQKTVDVLHLKILNAHLDRSMMLMECNSDLTTNKFSNRGYTVYPVKPFLSKIDVNNQLQVIRAYHWLNWHNESKYCGRCGIRLTDSFDTTEKKCSACQVSFFPRFSPAVMVLIQKGDNILLARSPHFQPGIYSAIAGFIDVGESAEQAAHREVKEEVGLDITHLKYFSSQTWPFPDSFMIAFTAKYLAGDITCSAHEIEAARWFRLDNLPKLPSYPSIARKLIDHVVTD